MESSHMISIEGVLEVSLANILWKCCFRSFLNYNICQAHQYDLPQPVHSGTVAAVLVKLIF